MKSDKRTRVSDAGRLAIASEKKLEADDDFNKRIELNPALRPEIEKAARVFN